MSGLSYTQSGLLLGTRADESDHDVLQRFGKTRGRVRPAAEHELDQELMLALSQITHGRLLSVG